MKNPGEPVERKNPIFIAVDWIIRSYYEKKNYSMYTIVVVYSISCWMCTDKSNYNNKK